MKILLTGAYGRVGTAIIDHLSGKEKYQFTYLDLEDPDSGPYKEFDTFVADVSDYKQIRPAFEDQDAVIHLAAIPTTEGKWPEVLSNNIIGMYNVLEATKEAGIKKFIFASTNHVVGMYERENAPDIYHPDHKLKLDHTVSVRPDSLYGVSKAFGEDLGRFYSDNYDIQFYALRICSLRHKKYNHPYGDAERGVDKGKWKRNSEAYKNKVARMKAMWISRSDFAQLIEKCLEDESVNFDIFYAVSNNDARWFDIDHARKVLGYKPENNGSEWDSPPERSEV